MWSHFIRCVSSYIHWARTITILSLPSTPFRSRRLVRASIARVGGLWLCNCMVWDAIAWRLWLRCVRETEMKINVEKKKITTFSNFCISSVIYSLPTVVSSNLCTIAIATLTASCNQLPIHFRFEWNGFGDSDRDSAVDGATTKFGRECVCHQFLAWHHLSCRFHDLQRTPTLYPLL